MQPCVIPLLKILSRFYYLYWLFQKGVPSNNSVTIKFNATLNRLQQDFLVLFVVVCFLL